MEIRSWLRTLQLGQYEALLHAEGIEADVLPDLTEADLEKIGLPLGPRKRLLRAIAALGQSSQNHVLAPGSTELEGERRQLTVMFCDLVGSTALSTSLDPEDMRELIRAYQRCCADAVNAQDGFIAKYMGDGVLAYFGYPRAREDDPERAAHAALDLVARLSRLNAPAKLMVRIGIATGLVVVGDILGDGVATERAVTGDTPNLAARLQAIAEPGTVVVSAITRRLLGNFFKVNDLGPQQIKGYSDPIPAHVIVAAAENTSRFEAKQGDTLTPFIGRDREFSLLIDLWRQSSAGQGQLVLLSGEAGIGKSRLLAELRNHLEDSGAIVLPFQCSPRHTGAALYPVLDNLRRAAGLKLTDAAGTQLDKLKAVMHGYGMLPDRSLPVLADLLSISTESRYPALTIPPAELKSSAFAALSEIFIKTASQKPTLILLEDAHWIDPTSMEFFHKLFEKIESAPVLLIVTFRPGVVGLWAEGVRSIALSLDRFGREHAAALASRFTEGKDLPDEVLDGIIARADGVPLFVEELTKSVVEAGSSPFLDRSGDGKGQSALRIPITLHDALMARLDRLGTAKELAQVGSVIGREFSIALLREVTDISESALRVALEKLSAAELIDVGKDLPDLTCTFKHALVQDAAYASLLRTRRRAIHSRIAKALASGKYISVIQSPAILAHHYTEAGSLELAAHAWLADAEHNLARSAYTEAGRAVQSGLSLLPHLEVGPARENLEFALKLAHANTLLPVNGYAEKKTVLALTEAKLLLDRCAATSMQRLSVLYGLCAANYMGGHMNAGLQLAREIVEISHHERDPVFRLVGYRVLGSVEFYMGQNIAALTSLQHALLFCDRAKTEQLRYKFGWDPRIAAKCFQLWAMMHIGDFSSALDLRAEIVSETKDLTHAPTIAGSRWFTQVYWNFFLRDYSGCRAVSEAFENDCREKSVGYWSDLGALFKTVSAALSDPQDQHIAAVRTAILRAHKSGARVADSVFLTCLGEALIAMNEVDAAEAALEEASKYVAESGETFWLSVLLRISAALALKRNPKDTSQAESLLLRSIAVAKDQGACMLELRSAMDLVWLKRATIAREEAEHLLCSALNSITGDMASVETNKARALIESIPLAAAGRGSSLDP